MKGYDYTTAGAYFITLVAYQRDCLFGEIQSGEMRLSRAGEVVRSTWLKLPSHFHSLELDELVVMPNHVHGILWLGGTPRKGEAFAQGFLQSRQDLDANASPLPINGTQPGFIGAIVQNFKSVSTRRINRIRKTAGTPVWQRNYYEHIIRNDCALQQIRQYIENNPLSWQSDQLHPDNPSRW